MGVMLIQVPCRDHENIPKSVDIVNLKLFRCAVEATENDYCCSAPTHGTAAGSIVPPESISN